MALPGRELLLDALKGSVLTLTLFLAYVTFPVVGLLPGMLAPLPAIYYFCKRGKRTGFAVLLITTAVLLLMRETAVPLLYLLQAGIIGLLLPWFYLQGKGTARAIAVPVGINFLLIVAVVVTYGFWSGTDLQAILLQGIKSSGDQAIAIYSKQGLSAEDLETLSQGIRQAGALIARIFPALLMVALGSIAAMNMAMLFRIAGKWLPNLPQPDRFQTFRNPDALVWVVIIAGFSMLLPQPDIQRAALNLLVVSAFIYFLQGLAVVLAFFQKIAVPALARFIFWLVLLFQPYLVVAIAFLGIFDIWADFRSPKEKNL
jgi:uncharacterized protein YybS (DUF2232 family)